MKLNKLCIIKSIMSKIVKKGHPGENSVSITFYSDFNSGLINFLLNYKCNNGESDFHDLDQAIAKLNEIYSWIKT